MIPTALFLAALAMDDAIVVTAARPHAEFSVVEPDAQSTQNSLTDFLAGVPGVIARNRNNYAQDEQIAIRGFGARASFGVRGLRLLVDGIPATQPDGQSQTGHFDFAGAQRIEILRGPFSALYGNSSGGVIRLITADEQKPGAGGMLGGGSFGAAQTNAYVHGGAERRSYSLDANYFRTGGWRGHSAAERWIASLALHSALGGGHIKLLFNSFDLPEAQDPQGLTWAQVQGNPRQAAPAALQFNTRKSVHQYQGGAIYAVGDFQLTGYFGSRGVEQYLSVPVVAQANPLHSGGVVDLANLYGGIDARWTWRADFLEVTTGLAYDRQNQRRRGYENFDLAQLGVRGALRRDEDARVYTLDQYVQAGWRFAPEWSALAGVRNSIVRFEVQDHFVTADNPDDSGGKYFAALTPVAGLRFSASEAWRLHASYGRGFETPTYNELAYRSDGGAGLNLALKAARSDHFELGAARRAAGGVFELALFHADARDELAVFSSSGGRTTFQYIERARRRGVELGVQQPLGAHWRASAAYTLLDARFATGARIPGIAQHAAYAQLRGSFAYGWFASADLQAASGLAADDAGVAHVPGFAVLGASAGRELRVGATTLTGFVQLDNLLDKTYVGSVIVNESNGRYYEPAAGFNVFAGLRLRY